MTTSNKQTIRTYVQLRRLAREVTSNAHAVRSLGYVDEYYALISLAGDLRAEAENVIKNLSKTVRLYLLELHDQIDSLCAQVDAQPEQPCG